MGHTPVVEVSRHDLTPGRLARLFREGAVAVILVGDERVPRLWRELVERPDDAGRPNRERLPWEESLFEVARNHRSNAHDLEGQLGDLLRYVPGGIGYMARKIDLAKPADGTEVTSSPRQFQRGDTTYSLPREVTGTLWELGADVWTSLLPEPGAVPYCVALERLKYSDDLQSFEELVELLRYAGGPWSSLGHRLDADAELMRRATGNRLLRHALAFLCLIPRLAPAIRRRAAARAARSRDFGDVGGGTIIGHPHTDGRYLNCMCGERDAIRTEVLADGKWLPIPMRRDSLAIIPGADLARLTDIRPTVHRVIHTEPVAQHRKPPWCNVTLVIGLKDPARSMADPPVPSMADLPARERQAA